MNIQPAAFNPPFGLRSAVTQSILASKRPARWLWRRRGVDLHALSSHHVLQTEDEQREAVQLSGWYTPRESSRGLVVLIHGWEGCHESSYLYSLACCLYRAGYALFRLNLRDHGDSHHLNVGIFHSARFAEVLGAVKRITEMCSSRPLSVIGFSLGGNFALRVGMRGPVFGICPQLCIGISPAVNPGSSLRAITEGPRLVHRYFLDKWHKTLDAKAKAFPDRYDFSRHRHICNFVEITRAFVEDFTEYKTLESYLAQYTLTPALLMESPTPLAILTAEDDSVCPPADFAGLSSARRGVVSYQATQRGGHCGFIENWRLDSWLEGRVLDLLDRAANPEG